MQRVELIERLHFTFVARYRKHGWLSSIRVRHEGPREHKNDCKGTHTKIYHSWKKCAQPRETVPHSVFLQQAVAILPQHEAPAERAGRTGGPDASLGFRVAAKRIGTE